MAPAERMKAVWIRLRAGDPREVRIVVPDARSPSVRQRIGIQAAWLDLANEYEDLHWIEAVSEFDSPGMHENDETR